MHKEVGEEGRGRFLSLNLSTKMQKEVFINNPKEGST